MSEDLKKEILLYLDQNEKVTTAELAKLLSVDEGRIIGSVKSLTTLGDVIEAVEQRTAQWQLTDEGEAVAEKGSYEFIVFAAVKNAGGLPMSDIKSKIPNGQLGFSKAIANKWVKMDKASGKVCSLVETVVDTVQEDLTMIKTGRSDLVPEQRKQEYKKRTLIKELTFLSYLLKKGKSFTISTPKFDTELTAAVLTDGSWKTRNYKSYNFNALGVRPKVGLLHPLTKVREEFKQIFLGMGFSEMPTNKYVESSFWNFDALFQPQQHPARDAHDTFFLNNPKLCNVLPEDYMKLVKKVHSEGGYGSQGYKYHWSENEARKNLLRTHTTATSATMLSKLNKEFKPVKLFSIDKVFRNETLDATHLAEFHQIEGVVADYNLTLGDLIGLLYEFFNKLGIENLKFKPAYNPYTEPSMEIFCFHPGLKKWIEVGNSGMFRPEMLLPMGIPSNVNVIAWGLSLERPTMIKYGINNIRDLIGPKVNLRLMRNSPLCRLDN